ncbi:MAG: putative structural protein [Prokaryotic dsDNA virus sp.]|jgi:hypothetical protein|nr:MAG: putative structural protein [Prokaryotic dsDNA virus sp.]|tara:strand:+ start:15890 stop:16810 length:921 start_codon:yes stop_codon:yes gene_type:complete
MAYITNYKYYTNEGVVPESANWGEYQFVTLKDIVNNFMLMYVGDTELINNVKRYAVLFHAKRGIQEINYDALRNIKVLQMDVDENLKFILPPDYVNYVRVSVEKDGVLYPLHENTKINYASEYLEDNNGNLLFDQNGEVLEAGNSQLDRNRLAGLPKKRFLGVGDRYGDLGWCVDGCWYFSYGIGGYYGLDTETANINDSFRIDKASGVINFSSGVKNQSIVLEYVSDGMENGQDDLISINKLAEDYIYAYIKWAILSNRVDAQEYVVRRARREKMAKLRNAKIRLSNMHAGRLLMNLRGRDKWIK